MSINAKLAKYKLKNKFLRTDFDLIEGLPIIYKLIINFYKFD